MAAIAAQKAATATTQPRSFFGVVALHSFFGGVALPSSGDVSSAAGRLILQPGPQTVQLCLRFSLNMAAEDSFATPLLLIRAVELVP